MKISKFDYYLPSDLIAQEPISPRDHSRLLILDKKNNRIIHDHFYHLPKYLQAGDVLIFNDSKVIPARLHGKKITGGHIEIFLLQKIKQNTWQCLVRGKIKMNQIIFFKNGFTGKIIKTLNASEMSTSRLLKIKFNKKNILTIGETPTPPYIKKKSNLKEYQTVYAKHKGSIAAPTAGFHFTKNLLHKLKKKGIQLEYVTLHVGLGTFAPVKVDDITKHKMHTEYFSIKKEVLARIKKAKQEKRRIIAVGTTSCRVLESNKNKNSTNIFIYPGYKFKYINSLITNFHLPKSTLLMLVSAFAGTKKIKKAYHEAIRKKYRFYSFGDAMLII
jgi:S-adenosylmethionine:tRNA ribosyltransferase-isomerase